MSEYVFQPYLPPIFCTTPLNRNCFLNLPEVPESKPANHAPSAPKLKFFYIYGSLIIKSSNFKIHLLYLRGRDVTAENTERDAEHADATWTGFTDFVELFTCLDVVAGRYVCSRAKVQSAIKNDSHIQFILLKFI